MTLALNDSSIVFINRDMAVFLGFLTLLSFLFHVPYVNKNLKCCRWAVDFLRESWKEILAIFLLRAFFYEMYMIPSSSMQPTVYPGDIVLVNKYDYGFKMPGTNHTLWQMNQPARGDVVVFLDPQQPTVRKMIKRVIGLPGDRIIINKDRFEINGQEVQQSLFYRHTEHLPYQKENYRVEAEFYHQDLDQHHVVIERMPALKDQHLDLDFEVPQGHYFVMGDNRENSADSRYIGFVPNRFICGKAERVLMSFGRPRGYWDFSRIGALP